MPRLLLLSFLLAGCSTCLNDIVDQVSSVPQGMTVATLSTRKCGSFEGWVVTLKSANLAPKEVFLGEMPDPVSVDEVKNAVKVIWVNDYHLIIEGPRWVGGLRAEKKYGDISIAYEPNEIAYPKEASDRHVH